MERCHASLSRLLDPKVRVNGGERFVEGVERRGCIEGASLGASGAREAGIEAECTFLHLVNRRRERPAGRQNVRRLCCFSERLAGHALFLSLSINLHPCRVAVRVYRHEVVLWWGSRMCGVLLGR